MEITLPKLVGYLFGIGAIFSGAVFGIVGLGVLLGNIIGGLAVLFASLLLVAAGVVALPAVRNLLANEAEVELSTGATAAISGGFTALAITIILAVSIAAVFSGAGGGGATDSGGDADIESTAPADRDVSALQVHPSNTSGSAASYEDNAAKLPITYNERVQASADPSPDDDEAYYAEDGRKFVAVQMQIDNRGDVDIDLGPQAFILVIDGAEYSYQPLQGSGAQLGSVTLRPDGSVSGWLLFQVPEDAGVATIELNEDYYQQSPAAQFEHDVGIEVQLAEGE